MTFYAHDSVMDAALARVAESTEIVLCAGAPSAYSDISTVSLGGTALDGADFTTGDGGTGGRRLEIAAKDVSVTDTGEADHVAYHDGVDLIYVKELVSSRAVESGDTVSLTSSSVTIDDPVAA